MEWCGRHGGACLLQRGVRRRYVGADFFECAGEIHALAREDFGKYLALGVTVTVILQALFNMSVVLDMAPTKGFPLPMVSFGGSSLLSTLASLGMLLSVGEHEG